MSVFDNIQVRAEAPQPAPSATGNALPLLHEIRHALRQLSDAGTATVLDLRAIPFGPGDEERLFLFLGTGEVTATVNTLGESIVRETRYPAVWVVEHRNPDNERIALQIEITDIPDILKTQRGDITESLALLDDRLGAPGEEGVPPS